MLNGFRLPTLVGLVLLACAAPARAQDDKVAKLEAMLEQQNKKIQSLEQRLATSGAQNMDAARVEQMKAQIREVLGEAQFRESLMPSTLQAGYDKGFFIRSSDNNFEMKFNGGFQFRWTHYATRSTNRWLSPRLQRDDRTGFDLNRLRFVISGHAWDPNLTYHIQMRADAVESHDVVIHAAWFNYRFADEFQIKGGAFTHASLAQTMRGWSEQQAIDRNLVDAVFGLGRSGIGLRFWGQLFGKRLDYYLDVVNSTGDDENAATNRTISPDPSETDNQPAILARLVWHALGEKPGEEFDIQSDIEHHTAPALDIGMHYAFNDDEGDLNTTRLPFQLPRRFARGGFGLTTIRGTQINQFGWDAALKILGFSVTGEYVLRIVDPRRAGRTPYTPVWLLSGDDSTTVMHGAYVQTGYFLPIPGMEKKLEWIARVGGISTNIGGSEGTWEYATGLNYYLKGNDVKLQADMVKVSELPISNSTSSFANVNDDALIFRVQLSFTF